MTDSVPRYKVLFFNHVLNVKNVSTGERNQVSMKNLFLSLNQAAPPKSIAKIQKHTEQFNRTSKAKHMDQFGRFQSFPPIAVMLLK